MKEKRIQTDVLCVGAGIAGLMAGIRAAEKGARVILAEKGHALHSGRGRGGNDHFWCYIPEIHGPDLDLFMRECLKGPKLKTMQSGTASRVLRAFLEKSFDIVKLWDDWGIPMKYQGRWEFAGHSFPGDVLTHLKYAGRDQKKIMIQKALDLGAEIVNRVMIFDLLKAGDSVIGAIGIDTREDSLVVFEAKAVVLGTGCLDRLYPPPTPAWMPSIPGNLTLTGDGRAMAYRAGADIVGPEMPKRHVGPRYFSRFGQATWIGVLRDPQDKPIGPYVTRPHRVYGDMTPEVKGVYLEEFLKTGKGPVYMDCRGISEEDYAYMMHWMWHEGNAPILDHMKEEGIDFRKHPIEFQTYHIIPEGKIWINEKGETSVQGLYSAGDESMGGISCAATFGWIAGDNAAGYARNIPSGGVDAAGLQISEKRNRLEAIESRKEGPDWREVNIALQQLMQDYAGVVRSETLLTAGLEYLQRMRKKVDQSMVARNRWELTRCLETLNLLDLGELVFSGASARKETRGLHIRSDYPLTDPVMDGKEIFVKKANGKPLTEAKKA
ncbi:MAG: FAD-dependent oxidoreductase [Deltaproteobacteria bacterium HGW-Deltaproteobacteria-15]|nr:MAG: FAD-dependent oxidoreductase [Deltaproteobacteria bacterium HGW-Deltaproteobacteria-15]